MSQSSIAVMRCTVFGVTWTASPGFISRFVELVVLLSISNSSRPDYRKIVSSFRLWYWRLSAWPALT